MMQRFYPLELFGRVRTVVAAMPVRDRLMRLSLGFVAVTAAVLMVATDSTPTLLVVTFASALTGLVVAVVEVGLLAAAEHTDSDEKESR